MRVCLVLTPLQLVLLVQYLMLQVLFPNEAVALLLARMIAMLGPIDVDMLQNGQETHKYFTNEYDLYYTDEVWF